MPHLSSRYLAVPLSVVAAAAGLGVGGASALAAGTTYYVATSGSDSNPCTEAQPCATIQYAVGLAAPGDTVKVEAGTYNQTVNITKPLRLVGAGPSKTLIDGHGIDTAAMGYYGVVSVQNNPGPAGTVFIGGMTVEHAFITSTEYSEDIVPSDVSIYDDANPADAIQVNNVALGPVDDTTDYGGIGFDTFNDVASVKFSDSSSFGNFQGALLEGGGLGGAVTVVDDSFSNLVACSASCGGGSSYPAEGVFLLSDQPGTATATIEGNTFKGYAGFGIAAAAGYSGGNCTPPNGPCTGNVDLTADYNTFALGACGASDGCAAIILDAQSGNELTATLKGNSGYVTKPDQTIVEQPDSGVYNVTESNNRIRVHS